MSAPIDLNAKREALEWQRFVAQSDASEARWYAVVDAIAAAMSSLPPKDAVAPVLRAMLDTLHDDAGMSSDEACALIERYLNVFREVNKQPTNQEEMK